MTDSQESNPVPEDIRWTDWPARRAPGRAALAAALVLVPVLLVARVDPWLAPAVALVLLTATADVLLPASFRVDARGVLVRRLFLARRLEWARLDRVEDRDGVLRLFPQEARPWLARARSLALYAVPEAARARILAAPRGRSPG